MEVAIRIESVGNEGREMSVRGLITWNVSRD